MKLLDLIKQSASALQPVAESPAFEARLLIARGIERPVTWLLAHPEANLTPAQVHAAQALVAQRTAGAPLPYILGRWEFFGREFIVTPNVLIPRPETELLVEAAIRHGGATLLDIGTGSGCIAISLAKALPQAHIIATDISAAALEVARENAQKHGVQTQITFIQSDLFPPSTFNLQPSTFDLIVSNPPYIPTETLKGLAVFGREPRLALDGGPDGLAVTRRLLEQARGRRALRPNGAILLEIESTLGEACRTLAASLFPDCDVRIQRDLAGKDRVLAIFSSNV